MPSDNEKPAPAPKWLDPADDNRRRPKKSKRHETRLADELGGKRYPQSGAQQWSKWEKVSMMGDITTPTLHIEHKSTQHDSMSLKRAWLIKVTEGAKAQGKSPAMILTFETPEGKALEDWVVIPMRVLKILLGDPNAKDLET